MASSSGFLGGSSSKSASSSSSAGGVAAAAAAAASIVPVSTTSAKTSSSSASGGTTKLTEKISKVSPIEVGEPETGAPASGYGGYSSGGYSSGGSSSGDSGGGSSGGAWSADSIASNSGTPLTTSDPYDAEKMSQASKNLSSSLGELPTINTSSEYYKDVEDMVNKLQTPDEVALPDSFTEDVTVPNTPESVVLPDAPENNAVIPDVPDSVELPDLPDVDMTDFDKYEDTLNGINAELSGMKGDVDIGRIDNVNIDEEKALLEQLKQSQIDQSNAQIDNSVRNSTIELQRNMQDSQEQYQSQRDQIDTELQRALDNQALYASARGDRGGIGQAQYNTIQNTAATNKLTVQKEQTKLATDTARQIADLRAQGEFEKADNLLTITQNYLSQLMQLSQWQKEMNISIDEFNIQVAQWEKNYQMSLMEAGLNVANSQLNLATTKYNMTMEQYNAALNLASLKQNITMDQFNAALSVATTQHGFDMDAFNAALNLATTQHSMNMDQYNAALNSANLQHSLNMDKYNADLNLATTQHSMNMDQYNAALNQANAQLNVANAKESSDLNRYNAALNGYSTNVNTQLNIANSTGAYSDGNLTFAALQAQNSNNLTQQEYNLTQLSNSGKALLEAGVLPTTEQLSAMGMTKEQAISYLNKYFPGGAT